MSKDSVVKMIWGWTASIMEAALSSGMDVSIGQYG